MHPQKIKIGVLMAIMTCFGCSHSEKEEDHHEESHQHSGEIHLDEDQASSFGIEYEKVAAGTFHDVIKASGTIESSGSDVMTATAKKSGILSLRPGINEGALVKSGEVIATITAEGVEGGDVSAAAHANLRAAKPEYERLKPLYEDGLVTASAYREAERAYREAEALAGKKMQGGVVSVTAPGEGTLVNLYVRNGEYVEVGKPIAAVVKSNRQILKVDLPVREASHLAHLQSANFIPEGSNQIVRLEDMEGQKISGGHISSVYNGYTPVYFSFMGNSLTSPGGYAEVYLLCGRREGVISVPREALIEVQGNKYAYVAEHGHGYEKRLVKTGASDGERVEILEGLEEGDTVVSKGASIIRMAEISAVAPPAHTHNH